jgi:nitrous oxidase accessory protein NosD
MRRPAAVFTIALAFGAMILAPRAGAREEGPTEIDKCQTISNPGSYKLVNNITFTGTGPDACLLITADFVSIDLAGFTISKRLAGMLGSAAIRSTQGTRGIAVRNGSILDFGFGVDLSLSDGSIVEGLRVFGVAGSEGGIFAKGIVKGNTVLGILGVVASGTGIFATGIVTGNYASGNRVAGIVVGQGSTVIGNTSTDNLDPGIGIFVSCPSNVTDNTAINNFFTNLELSGNGCNNTNNVAP